MLFQLASQASDIQTRLIECLLLCDSFLANWTIFQQFKENFENIKFKLLELDC